jgi:hypothetical protein
VEETTRTIETLFRNLEVGISISESPDLEALGFGEVHLVEAMLEFARHVLLCDGTVAYGGDLRPGGFTEDLLALAERITNATRPVVHSYLAWPIHLGLIQARVDDLAATVRFDRLPEVTGVVDPGVAPSGPQARLVVARNLTAMRRAMAESNAVRVVLGGRVAGAAGAMPGIVEEALLAVEQRKPLFVLGAFGGCARVVWDAIAGAAPAELGVDYQEQAAPGYADLVRDYNAWATSAGAREVDYTAIRAAFSAAGPGGLNNGLTAAENARLAVTPYVPEMVALFLLGCRRLFGV